MTTKSKLDKLNDYSYHFYFYAPLLTERQQLIFRLYYQQDFSLKEIATQLTISKPAVLDSLQTTQTLLKSYENKIKLIEKVTILETNIEALKANLAKDQTALNYLATIEDIF